MRISVLTWTFREPSRLLLLAEALAQQTFKEFEWVLVDDLAEERRGFLPSLPFPVQHIAPREVKATYSPEIAVNTGLVHARGELIYCISDYIKPSPGALQRHWDIYEGNGRKVQIGGQVSGEGVEQRGSDEGLAPNLGELRSHDTLRRNAFLGRGESFPLEAALLVNGLDEFEARAGTDVIFAMRMKQRGYRYLVDTQEIATLITTDKPRKPEGRKAGRWEDLFETARKLETVSNCPINLRAERERLCMSAS